MNIYDYLVGITIGSIAADIALDIEKSLIAGIVSLVILGLSGVLVTYLTLKSVAFRRIFIKQKDSYFRLTILNFYNIIH